MAQELVGAGQLVKFLAADMAFVMQLLQRKKRAAGAQPGLGTAIHALQALHQKLDIADATPVDFYVDRLVRLIHRHPPTPRVHPLARLERRLDGRKIEPCCRYLRRQAESRAGRRISFLYAAAVYERLHAADELTRPCGIAARMAHLDQGLAFPVMRSLSVVPQCVAEADRKFSLSPCGRKRISILNTVPSRVTRDKISVTCWARR